MSTRPSGAGFPFTESGWRHRPDDPAGDAALNSFCNAQFKEQTMSWVIAFRFAAFCVPVAPVLIFVTPNQERK